MALKSPYRKICIKIKGTVAAQQLPLRYRDGGMVEEKFPAERNNTAGNISKKRSADYFLLEMKAAVPATAITERITAAEALPVEGEVVSSTAVSEAGAAEVSAAGISYSP